MSPLSPLHPYEIQRQKSLAQGCCGIVIFGLAGILLVLFAIDYKVAEHKDARMKEAAEAADAGDYGRAIELMGDKLDKATDPVVAYSYRGFLYSQKGDYEKARADLARAQEIDPSFAWSYAVQANMEEMQGDTDAAIEACGKAIEQRPPNYNEIKHQRGKLQRDGRALALYLRACLQMDKRRDWTAAADDLEQRIRIGGRSLPDDLYERFGKACRMANLYQKALDLFRDVDNAVTRGSPKPPARMDLQRGLVLCAMGEEQKAEAAFQTYFAAEKDTPLAWNSTAWALATDPDPNTRNAELALKYAKKSVEATERKDACYLDTLAAATAAAGRFAEAVSIQQEAISVLGPDEAKAEYEKHLRLYRKGQPAVKTAPSAVPAVNPPPLNNTDGEKEKLIHALNSYVWHTETPDRSGGKITAFDVRIEDGRISGIIENASVNWTDGRIPPDTGVLFRGVTKEGAPILYIEYEYQWKRSPRRGSVELWMRADGKIHCDFMNKKREKWTHIMIKGHAKDAAKQVP